MVAKSKHHSWIYTVCRSNYVEITCVCNTLIHESPKGRTPISIQEDKRTVVCEYLIHYASLNMQLPSAQLHKGWSTEVYIEHQ